MAMVSMLTMISIRLLRCWRSRAGSAMLSSLPFISYFVLEQFKGVVSEREIC